LLVFVLRPGVVDCECTQEYSLPKCEQIQVIGKATGRSECQYLRDYYRCLKLEECYDLPDACRTDTEEPIACRDLCEAEPGFAYCVDEVEREDPEEDYHLCPHVPKSSLDNLPPSGAELENAVPLPYTATVWTSFVRDELSLHPSSVLPIFWVPAGSRAISDVLGRHNSTVVVEEPIAYRGYPTTLDNGPIPPVWAQQTSFFIFNVLVVEQGAIEVTKAGISRGIVGTSGANVTLLEQRLEEIWNTTIPALGRLDLEHLQIRIVAGRAEDFPLVTTTTQLTTITTTLDISLRLRLWPAWRVRCVDAVVYRWEVLELSLWSDGCPATGGGKAALRPNDAAGDGNSSIAAISSGAFDADHAAAKAFDGRVLGGNTSWLSACRGCNGGEAWLGIAVGSGAAPVTAACVVVRQASSPTGQCPRIALEASDNISDPDAWLERVVVAGLQHELTLCIPRAKEDYPLLQCGTLDDNCGGTIDFGSCQGYNEECHVNRCRCMGRTDVFDARFKGWQCGLYGDGCDGTLDFGTCTSEGAVSCVEHACIEENPVATSWRLVCSSGTQGRWWLREVEFHTEGLCQKAHRSFKQSISSGTYHPEHPTINAFDGDLVTSWGSQCSTCPPGAAWIGVDFGEEVAVSCVLLEQDERTMQQCPQMVLEYSDDGILWIERYRYGYGSHVIRASEQLQPDLDSRLNDEIDLAPFQRSAVYWRLSCQVELKRQWGVFELEFFDDEECTNSMRSGISELYTSLSASFKAENAFDGMEHTMWKPKCGRCGNADISCDPCDIGEAFIGAKFAQPVLVNCIKISQLEPGIGSCPKIQVQFSTSGAEGSWVVRSNFLDTPAFEYLVLAQGAESTDRAHRNLHMRMALLLSLISAALASAASSL